MTISALDVLIYTYGKGNIVIKEVDVKSKPTCYYTPRCKKMYSLFIGHIPDIINYTRPLNNILEIIYQEG